MSTTSAICQHSATYLDVDEVKCWSCNTSLTFPARPPGPEDVKNRRRDVRILAGEHRRRDSSPVEVEAEVSQLLCHCCRVMLPENDFYRNNHPTARNRNYRAPRCRGCTAFRRRVQRQLDPEGTRQRDRARRERYLIALTPEQREPEKQRRGAASSKEANALAQVRSRARQDGRQVPLQRSGRLSLHVKPVCRIYRECPLREFCTTSAKGLA